MSYNYWMLNDKDKTAERLPGFAFNENLIDCLEDLNAYNNFVDWDGGMIYLDESTVEIARERLGGEALQMLEVLEAARIKFGVDTLKVLIE